MMQTTHHPLSARFSLRTVLLVFTAAVIALGITAPWARSLSCDRQPLVLTIAAGELLA